MLLTMAGVGDPCYARVLKDNLVLKESKLERVAAASLQLLQFGMKQSVTDRSTTVLTR